MTFAAGSGSAQQAGGASASHQGRAGVGLPGLHCDLLVIGSGAGALGAAVTAAHLGLQVVVVEKEAVFGGTTAWSGGWMWAPRNMFALADGVRQRQQLALIGLAAWALVNGALVFAGVVLTALALVFNRVVLAPLTTRWPRKF